MARQMSALQLKYFGGKKRKAKKRVVRKHRSLGGMSGIRKAAPITSDADLKNGNGEA
jgi:hypothetical protein